MPSTHEQPSALPFSGCYHRLTWVICCLLNLVIVFLPRRGRLSYLFINRQKRRRQVCRADPMRLRVGWVDLGLAKKHNTGQVFPARINWRRKSLPQGQQHSLIASQMRKIPGQKGLFSNCLPSLLILLCESLFCCCGCHLLLTVEPRFIGPPRKTEDQWLSKSFQHQTGLPLFLSSQLLFSVKTAIVKSRLPSHLLCKPIWNLFLIHTHPVWFLFL